MPLLKLFRRLFPRFEPQRVALADLGEAVSDKYGWWQVQSFRVLNGRKVGLSFKSGPDPPGEKQLSLWHRIDSNWPEIWKAVVAKLDSELEVDDPTGERARFFKKLRPAGIVITGSSDEPCWELTVLPDIYSGHMVILRMNGLECEDFGFDG